jgi:alpha-tubulin suppressor-like RCC1 family protein
VGHIAAGKYFSSFIVGGSILASGWNFQNYLGLEDTSITFATPQPTGFYGFSKIVTYTVHSVATHAANGKLYYIGRGIASGLGVSVPSLPFSPRRS